MRRWREDRSAPWLPTRRLSRARCVRLAQEPLRRPWQGVRLSRPRHVRLGYRYAVAVHR